MSKKSSSLSTTIDPDLKTALNDFCKKRGLKIQHVVELALLEKLEDEIDLEAFRLRKDEDTVSLEDLLSKTKQSA